MTKVTSADAEQLSSSREGVNPPPAEALSSALPRSGVPLHRPSRLAPVCRHGSSNDEAERQLQCPDEQPVYVAVVDLACSEEFLELIKSALLTALEACLTMATRQLLQLVMAQLIWRLGNLAEQTVCRQS
uniref:Uncharacterized protein n=1 Tax=Zea mays TaxID=4577 RepID=A0A804N4X2_MAIZE